MKNVFLFVLCLLTSLLSNMTFAETEFSIKGEVHQVYFPGEFSSDLKDVCISEVQIQDGAETNIIILIEDYYACDYARQWRHKIGKQILLQEPSELLIPTTDYEVLRNYYPKASLYFLEIL